MRRLVLNGRCHAGGKPSPNSAPVYSGPLGGLKQLPCRTCSCSSCSNQAQALLQGRYWDAYIKSDPQRKVIEF